MYNVILFLHVIAACIWTGGHLIVAFMVLPRALQDRDPQQILDFESRYEKLGMPALIFQLLSGLWMAYTMIPDVAAWFSFATPQAILIFCKVALLLGTGLTALDAKTRIIPHLTADTLPKMAWRIRLVTLFAVLFVLVGVSFRGGLLMGLH